MGGSRGAGSCVPVLGEQGVGQRGWPREMAVQVGVLGQGTQGHLRWSPRGGGWLWGRHRGEGLIVPERGRRAKVATVGKMGFGHDCAARGIGHGWGSEDRFPSPSLSLYHFVSPSPLPISRPILQL